MSKEVELQKYKSSNIDDVIKIFKFSILGTCKKDYDEKQINAWLSGIERNSWNDTFLAHYSVLAYCDDEAVGFGDITKDGHINLLYVLPEFQHRGIASMICDKLEKQAKYKITVEASITAKGFFLKRGYAVVKEQTVFRREVALINYLMEKQIGCIK